ncbi:MAG: FAD-dependent oxidoreductase [Candidatus Methanomethyliaceae archaeon]|nr:FAD-dependent oxidoreductase [Candidatus Methanomethyliaceae archaeon]MDW7970596.1 FAD-dependent oxidoreductase [Nitrososphaerota archaeon]
MHKTEVLIVGGGLAGLTAAISSASNGSDTTIVTKTMVGGANTTSIAAGIFTSAMSSEDSKELHYMDTINAGYSLNDKALVKTMVNDAPKYFKKLLELGIEIDYGPVYLPGHSKPRGYVIKGKGVELQKILRGKCKELGVKFIENTLITSLISDGSKIIGAIGIRMDTMEIIGVLANSIILATGGFGEIYPYTLMPKGSSGYGASLGLRAGAEVIDMEFVQFYPTMIAEEGLPRLFVNYESLIKFGADIVDENEISIFKKNKINEPHKITRDTLSILMAKEMEKGNSLYLDCRGIKDEDIASSEILAWAVGSLESKGVPVRKRKIKVSPYAHFFMGGLRADANCATNIPGLFVAGEAMGGVHGANRIGGNALTACMVFGFRAGLSASLYCGTVDFGSENLIKLEASRLMDYIKAEGSKNANEVISIIREKMWNNVGIIRNRKGLEEALSTFNSLRDYKLSNSIEKIIVQMMLDCAEVISLSALIREESRGSHYRSDFPNMSNEWLKKIMIKIEKNECKVSFIYV